ncbi:ATP synthase subunit G atp20 [Dispira parvispora]|uniref:ATP synthase subunit G atp20 n=1 Tax=Dispira parvispora TaxID=1520584 RepID=A0A9W8E957_9FUNG|nr:ATP synthase subunit G atp20 [Dispira parvispora]
MASRLIFSRVSRVAQPHSRQLTTQEVLEKSKVFANKAITTVGAQTNSLVRTAQSVPPKINGFVDCTLYWSRVTKEIAKEVYKKEDLAPPSLADYSAARKQLEDLFKSEALKKLTRDDLIKAAVVGIEIAGFFWIGEIIGRRSLVGYDV